MAANFTDEPPTSIPSALISWREHTGLFSDAVVPAERVGFC